MLHRRTLFIAIVAILFSLQFDECFAQRIFDGRVEDVPSANSGTADYYYVPASGRLIITVGESVQVLGVEFDGFDYTQLNRNTPLGSPQQEDSQGLGFLSLTPFPTGVFDLGPILPPDISVYTGNLFDDRFPEIVARTAVAGMATESLFNVVNEPLFLEATGIVRDPVLVNAIQPVAGNEVRATYDPSTGEVIMSIGQGATSFTIVGPDILLANRNDDTALGRFEAGGLNHLVQAGDASGLPAGIFSLGNILEPGLNDPAAFLARYGDSFIESAPKTDTDDGSFTRTGFQILSPAAVPEPSSITCLGCLALAALIRRRRD